MQYSVLKNKKLWLAIILYTLYSILNTRSVFAQDFDSANYKIRYGNINMTSGDKSSENYRLSDTVGQLAAGEFSSSGYTLRAGFQYIHFTIPFRFTISNSRVDFGNLAAETPATGTTNLTVSPGSADSYQVTAAEKGKLQTFSANAIADTSCDSGTCTETSAQPWSLSSTYGFGYNMSGDDVPVDFASSSYFRPFADETLNETSAVVMSNIKVGRERRATTTFKVNISSVQPAGSYQTVIKFVATPSY